VLSLSGWAAKTGKKKKINQFTVSISHSSDYAVATVIMVGNLNALASLPADRQA
jgi:phosphopantetheinyl transferase (holo-ACP synthase)